MMVETGDVPNTSDGNSYEDKTNTFVDSLPGVTDSGDGDIDIDTNGDGDGDRNFIRGNEATSKDRGMTSIQNEDVPVLPLASLPADKDIDKSTLSREDKHSSSKGNEIEVNRVVRFLKHPSIMGLSPAMKETYLCSKGVSDDVIQTAMLRMKRGNSTITSTDNDTDTDTDTDNPNKKSKEVENIWDNSSSSPLELPSSLPLSPAPKKAVDSSSANDTKYGPSSTMQYRQQRQNPYQDATYQQQQQQQPYQQQQMNLDMSQPIPELPNPIIPLTIGGIVTLFGLASFRWLNGDDFVLFPPSSPTASNIDELNNNDMMGNANTNENATTTSTTDAIIENEMEDEEFENDDDINLNDAIIDHQNENQSKNQTTSNTYNHLRNNDKNDLTLSNDLRNLSLVIEKYTALQERNMKLKSDEKAKETTNSAMDLLRNHSSSSSVTINTANTANAAAASSSTANDEFKRISNDSGKSMSRKNDFIDLAVLVQITEFKCAIRSMTDQLVSLSSTCSTSSSSDNCDDQSEKATGNDKSQLDKINQNLNEITGYLQRLEEKFTSDESIAKTVIQSNSKEETANTHDEVDNKNIDKVKNKNNDNVETKIPDSCAQECKHDDQKNKSEIEEVPAPIPVQQDESVIPFEKQNQQKKEEKLSSPPRSNNDNIKKKDEENINNSSNFNEESQKIEVGKKALLNALLKMQESNQPSIVKPCAQMLFLYTSNLSANPNSKQYRKIYTNSKSFKNKIEKVEFAADVLHAVGFVDEGKSFLEWRYDAEIESGILLLQNAATLLKKIKAGQAITNENEDDINTAS